MAENTVVAVPRDGTISIINGDATTYTVSYENGDMNMSFDRAERVTVYDRGSVVGLRFANDPVPQISFTVHFREFTNDSADTIIDFVYKTGNSAAATSTGGTGFEPYLVTVEFQENMASLSGSNTKTTFQKVLLTASVAEGSPTSISFTGEVYGDITRATV